MRSHRRILLAITFLLVLLSPNLVSLVKAESISVSTVFAANDDGATPYDVDVNWANVTETAYTNVNLTLAPFQANNSDIVGTVVAPIIAPTAVRKNSTSLTAVQPILFSQQSILDGASISWWRSPIGNIAQNDTVNFQLYRSDSATNNVTAVSLSPPYLTFTQPASAHQVWSWTGKVNSTMIPYFGRMQSQLINASRNIYYNFTWLQANAAIVPNAYYYAYWYTTHGSVWPYTPYYTTNDVGNDGLYASWLNGTYLPVDMDQTVILKNGMSAGIAGIPNSCEELCNITLLANSVLLYNVSFPDIMIGPNVGDHRYLNIVQPIYNLNKTVGTGLKWSAIVRATDTSSIQVTGTDLGFNTTNLLFQRYVDLYTANGSVMSNKSINRIDFRYNFLKNQSFSYLAADPTGASEVLLQVACSADFNCLNNLRFRFKLYGYFNIDTFFIENTVRNIVLLLIEDPRSELGRVQAFQQWQAAMALANQANNCAIAATFGRLGVVEATQGQFIGGAATTIAGLVINKDCAVQGVLDGFFWTLSTTFRFLTTFFQPAIDFLFAIGSFIWSIIEFVINAIEWFLFWAVKFINVFIVAAVFSIAVLSPTYVGRGLFEFVRRGFDGSVMRDVLRLGWERVWSIIQLLLSLATMAIAAIAAVAGIVGGLIP